VFEILPLELQPLAWWLQAHLEIRSPDERGEVVPWVLIVAISAALAIAVGAIIVAKVMGKANSVNLNGGSN
jgi:hypothetical protein